MTISAIVRAGAYAMLVPLVGATGTWTGAMSAAPFVNCRRRRRRPPTDVPVHGGRLERRERCAGPPGRRRRGRSRADQGPAWMAWRVPAVSRPGDRSDWGDGEGRCVLDDDGEFRGDHGIRGNLEDLVVARARRPRGASIGSRSRIARCTVDAGSRADLLARRRRPGRERPADRRHRHAGRRERRRRRSRARRSPSRPGAARHRGHRAASRRRGGHRARRSSSSRRIRSGCAATRRSGSAPRAASRVPPWSRSWRAPTQTTRSAST